MTTHRFSIAMLSLFAWTDVLHAQSAEAGAESVCILLDNQYDESPEFEDILSLELGERGIAVRNEDAAACPLVRVETLSNDVAVIELANNRSRVVDLSAVAALLRPRSLALAVAEEVHAVSVNAPDLLPPPVPVATPTNEQPPIQATPPLAPQSRAAVAVPSEPPWAKLIVGGSVERFFGSRQTLGALRLGLEFDLHEVAFGAPQAGIHSSYGNKEVSGFGLLDVGLFGGWLAWDVTALDLGAVSFHAALEVTAGAAWLHGRPRDGSSLNTSDVVTPYLKVSLALRMRVALGDNAAIEAGVLVGGLPVGAEAFGDDDVIGGASGLTGGGVLALLINI